MTNGNEEKQSLREDRGRVARGAGPSGVMITAGEGLIFRQPERGTPVEVGKMNRASCLSGHSNRQVSMRNLMRLGVISVLTATSFTLVPAAHAQSASCQPADSISSSMVTRVRSLMTPTHILRLKLNLPLVSAASVSQVSSEATCARVREALDSLIVTTNSEYTPAPRPLYVVQLGTYFAALDPAVQPDEWRPLDFFSDLFAYLSTLEF